MLEAQQEEAAREERRKEKKKNKKNKKKGGGGFAPLSLDGDGEEVEEDDEDWQKYRGHDQPAATDGPGEQEVAEEAQARSSEDSHAVAESCGVAVRSRAVAMGNSANNSRVVDS